MNTESNGQTPWYSRKWLFLLVGAIILVVSVFGYVWSQSWIAVDLQLMGNLAEDKSRVALGLNRNLRDERYLSPMFEDFSVIVIYNALSAAGIAIGIILVVYGLIPKRQSG